MRTLRPSRTFGAMRMKFAGSARSCMLISVEIMPVGENDPPALRPEAPRRRLQQPHHTQTHLAVTQRSCAVADALGEVGRHRLQRLARRDVRAPHVAGAV